MSHLKLLLMGLLNDQELVKLIVDDKIFHNGLDENYQDEDENSKVWFKKNSIVQPSSIDLHVGEIFVPGKGIEQQGGAKRPMTRHVIGPGQTAVVKTKEVLKVPGDIAAFGFPPDSVSSMGILMTNPGHIDPGFEGQLKFTLINMSKKSFPLSTDDVIATLLFMKINFVTKDYLDRRQSDQDRPVLEKPSKEEQRESKDLKMAEMLDSLNHDFMDIDERTKKMVNKKVWNFVLSGSILAALATAIIQLSINTFSPAVELQRQLKELEFRFETLPEIKELKEELNSLKMIVTRDSIGKND